jgi:very-short-patch-repair endonuclease
MEGRRVRGTSRELEARARVLRHSPTRAEDFLWNGLRGWKLAKFRRQHPVDRFILDFYCASAKLCIEVDGGIHDEQQERDAARTEYLSARGIRVIRFTNDEVLGDMRSVLRRIEAALKHR